MGSTLVSQLGEITDQLLSNADDLVAQSRQHVAALKDGLARADDAVLRYSQRRQLTLGAISRLRASPARIGAREVRALWPCECYYRGPAVLIRSRDAMKSRSLSFRSTTSADSPLGQLLAAPTRAGELVWIGLRPARRAPISSRDDGGAYRRAKASRAITTRQVAVARGRPRSLPARIFKPLRRFSAGCDRARASAPKVRDVVV